MMAAFPQGEDYEVVGRLAGGRVVFADPPKPASLNGCEHCSCVLDDSACCKCEYAPAPNGGRS